jgi:hypothetical protein
MDAPQSCLIGIEKPTSKTRFGGFLFALQAAASGRKQTIFLFLPGVFWSAFGRKADD